MNVFGGNSFSIFFQIVFCVYSSVSESNNKEGDICTTNGDSCKKLKDCDYYNVKDIKRGVFQPPICGYNGSEPIVCCTKSFNKIFGFGRRTKSAEMCEKYDHQICSDKRSNEGYTDGDDANIPFMALIGYELNNRISWRCGGSILSTRYIISAAECSNNKDLGPPKWAKIGKIGDKSKSKILNIDQHFNHPDYRNQSLYDDIALYKTKEEIVFNEYIRPICLHQYVSILTHRTVFVAGKHTYRDGNRLNINIVEVELNLLPLNDCNVSQHEENLPKGPSKRGMICAEVIEGDSVDCPEDNGGPVYLPPTKGQTEDGCFLFTLVGLTVTPHQCENSTVPGVYTNVGNYISWIESIVWSDDGSSDNAPSIWFWS